MISSSSDSNSVDCLNGYNDEKLHFKGFIDNLIYRVSAIMQSHSFDRDSIRGIRSRGLKDEEGYIKCRIHQGICRAKGSESVYNCNL